MTSNTSNTKHITPLRNHISIYKQTIYYYAAHQLSIVRDTYE